MVPSDPACIVVIDDNPDNLLLIERLLRRQGYQNIHLTQNPVDGLALSKTLGPDLILLDLHMPELNGFELLQRLRAEQDPDDFVPVLVLTADRSSDARWLSLDIGAQDFLAKPFDLAEVTLRVRNLLQIRSLHLHNRRQAALLEQHNRTLEARVLERTAELEHAHLETLARLARAAESRDDQTGRHTIRVGRNAGLLATALELPPGEVEMIRHAAPLHDVGKIGIPDAILLKPGRLTEEEFAIMRTHTTIGARILSDSSAHGIRLAEELALTHHERWDGTGYPHGLQGEAIPAVSRIVSIVDVFDALTHERPYKPAWSIVEALEELHRQSGRQFDPMFLGAFTLLVQKHGESLL